MALASVSGGNQSSTTYANEITANIDSSINVGTDINPNLLSNDNTLFIALLVLVISLLQELQQQDNHPEDQTPNEEDSDNQGNSQQYSDYPRYNYNIDFWGLNNFGYYPDFWSDYNSPFDSSSSTSDWW